MSHQIAQFLPVVGGLSKVQKTEGATEKSRSNPVISAQKGVFRCGKPAFAKTLPHFGTAIAFLLPSRKRPPLSSPRHIRRQSVPNTPADLTAAFNREVSMSRSMFGGLVARRLCLAILAGLALVGPRQLRRRPPSSPGSKRPGRSIRSAALESMHHPELAPWYGPGPLRIATRDRSG